MSSGLNIKHTKVCPNMTNEQVSNSYSQSSYDIAVICGITILAIMGWISNILVFVVIKKYLMKISVAFMLLAVSCIVDCLVIFVQLYDSILFYVPSILRIHDVVMQNDCYFMKFLFNLVMEISTWTLLISNAERICILSKFYSIETVKGSMKKVFSVLGGIILSLLLLNCARLAVYEIAETDLCDTESLILVSCIVKESFIQNSTSPEIVHHYLLYQHIALYGVIPFSVTFILNCILIYKVYKIKGIKKRRVSLIVTIMSVLFLLLTSPYMVYTSMVQTDTIPKQNYDEESYTKTTTTLDLLTRILLLIFYSLKIFICMAGIHFQEAWKMFIYRDHSVVTRKYMKPVYRSNRSERRKLETALSAMND